MKNDIEKTKIIVVGVVACVAIWCFAKMFINMNEGTTEVQKKILSANNDKIDVAISADPIKKS